MNTKPLLVVLYQLIFTFITIVLVTIIEGYGSEIFAGVIYFNIIYLVVGIVLNYLLYLVIQKICYTNKIKLLLVHFLACLFIMNCLTYYLNESWISWILVSNLFTCKSDSFKVALVIHLIMGTSYYLAFLLTKKKMIVLKSGSQV